jgi:hypothetical protein
MGFQEAGEKSKEASKKRRGRAKRNPQTLGDATGIEVMVSRKH